MTPAQRDAQRILDNAAKRILANIVAGDEKTILQWPAAAQRIREEHRRKARNGDLGASAWLHQTHKDILDEYAHRQTREQGTS